ncbi:MAG: monovalent cation/H+ antiporter subunit D family protein [Mariniblastus sp.]|nr:monovalent cation/H+ antiporter subunit D family protein [Mariniblastus sp.]
MTLTPSSLIVLSLVLPLVVFVLIGLFGKLANLRDGLTLILSSVLFYVVCCLADGVFAGGRPELSLGDMLPGFSIAFSIEPLGMVFALVASGLWIVTTVYAIGYMRSHREHHQTRFFACFAMAIFAALAAAFSANLFTLFVAYELMTISTYPLVTHHGTEKAKLGGRTYLGVLLFTSIAFFMMAIGWTWSVAHTLDFQLGGILREACQSGEIQNWQLMLLLALFAFGIGKAALMPFHRWLPAAMVAPTPVSALLHAVAVVKVGVFSVLKIAIYVFGIDLIRETSISDWLAYTAGFTILLASLVAMTKDNLKARLAYSTVSQLAYITLGAALATPASVMGSGMHIVMHAVGKITLFFCAGAIYVATHKTDISDMRGLGRAMPLTMGAFFIASISIIGLPPGGGAWSKWFLALGTVETSHYFLLAVLMISSLLNIAYLLPIPIRSFMKPKTGETLPFKEAPMMCVLPLCLTAIGTLVLFFVADALYLALLPITEVVK